MWNTTSYVQGLNSGCRVHFLKWYTIHHGGHLNERWYGKSFVRHLAKSNWQTNRAIDFWNELSIKEIGVWLLDRLIEKKLPRPKQHNYLAVSLLFLFFFFNFLIFLIMRLLFKNIGNVFVFCFFPHFSNVATTMKFYYLLDELQVWQVDNQDMIFFFFAFTNTDSRYKLSVNTRHTKSVKK